jgi:hypothetical protein
VSNPEFYAENSLETFTARSWKISKVTPQ